MNSVGTMSSDAPFDRAKAWKRGLVAVLSEVTSTRLLGSLFGGSSMSDARQVGAAAREPSLLTMVAVSSPVFCRRSKKPL